MHITENKTIMSFGKWVSMGTILIEGSSVKTESFNRVPPTVFVDH